MDREGLERRQLTRRRGDRARTLAVLVAGIGIGYASALAVCLVEWDRTRRHHELSAAESARGLERAYWPESADGLPGRERTP